MPHAPAQPRMRPVPPTQAPAHEPFKFDRRSSIRLPMTAVAMATFDLPDGGTILAGVEIVDTSAAGLGIRSPVEVKPGARFTLYPDTNTWPARSGTISRCSWDGEYYRCGLSLSLAVAA